MPSPLRARGRPPGRPNLPGSAPKAFRVLNRCAIRHPLSPLRPGRACLENYPACAPGKAGPTRFLRLRDASARDSVPPSAASARNQVGPVSPDAHASGAAGCFAPWFRPGRAAPGQNGKFGLGAIFPHPLVGSGGVCQVVSVVFDAGLSERLLAALEAAFAAQSLCAIIRFSSRKFLMQRLAIPSDYVLQFILGRALLCPPMGGQTLPR